MSGRPTLEGELQNREKSQVMVYLNGYERLPGLAAKTGGLVLR